MACPSERAPLVRAIAHAAKSSAVGELHQSGHVLLLSLLAYVLLSGAVVHIPGLIMLDVTQSLNLEIFEYTAALGVGNLIKAALVIFFAGPAMNHYGPHVCARVTLLAVAAGMVCLALVPSRALFAVVIVVLHACTAFGEQPCFIVLNASHFDTLLSVATASISSAFSIGGALLPLLLAPQLASHGWRSVCLVEAFCCVLLLPLLFLKMRPGVLRVGSTRSLPTTETDRTSGESGDSDGGGALTVAGKPTDPTVMRGESSKVLGGTSASAAFRGKTFWVLWTATFLHLTYGSLLSAHLLTILRQECAKDVLTASSLNAVQYVCAIIGKLLSGVLLGLPSSAPSGVARVSWAAAALFVIAPLAYAGSHLLLVTVHPRELLLEADFIRGLTFTKSNTRLTCYAVAVGLPFGLLFGTLQCLPARLFGRRDLPSIQSAIYSAILLSSSCFVPLVGYLRDAFGGYQLPLLVTFGTSLVQAGLLLFLMQADARASEAESLQYREVV